MVVAYVRVSTGRQDNDNQVAEIKKYAEANNITIDKWIEEIVSGTKDYNNRKLGKLLEELHEGDLLICCELSRLGRTLNMIFNILNVLIDKGVNLYAIKNNFTLKNDIQSKVLAFAFGLAAEVERDLISQRTKAALDRKRAEGVHLGRKKGSKNKVVKLTEKEPAIVILMNEGHNISQIARLLHVDRSTLSRYMRYRMCVGGLNDGSPDSAFVTEPNDDVCNQ